MKSFKAMSLYAMAACACLAGSGFAANVAVNANIATSTTWTASNVYNLVGQIYVLPGATLTIEPGTIVKSNPADGGSLAITRGAKIIANGTPTSPIIMTSTNDDLVTPRSAAIEWGNITILGKGLISASMTNSNGTQGYLDNSAIPIAHTNTGSPDGNNKAVMEGLVANPVGDPNVLYGGNDDNDDSGSLSYISLRYGGKVITGGVELNGLSMGGVGRETDVHHIDIWDNIDDGIETWGGTVNYKYLSIWNVGDDSFDVDQGWRGKAQFGLLVQGYSVNNGSPTTAQGSGVGDNLFEIDGAERSDAQPVTTAVIYNFTCIGQPWFDDGQGSTAFGDQGIALRDEARVQFRNCIFMDVGENVLKEEASETGTPNWRYHGTDVLNTPTYAQVWAAPFSKSWDKTDVLFGNHPNVAAYSQAQLQNMYQAQTSGNLLEISNCVFYHNLFPSAYTNATVGYDAVNLIPGNNNHDNVKEPANSPIKSITRGVAAGGFPLTGSGLYIQPVTALDPRAQFDAATSGFSAPADGFFTPATYRGAFSKDVNWAKGWTAASAYGLFPVADTATATNPIPSDVGVMVSTLKFPTNNGILYTIESSSDGKLWAPVAIVTGTGSEVTISAVVAVDPAKVYRAIAQ